AVDALKKKQWSEASTIFSNILAINPTYKKAQDGMERIASFSQLPKTFFKIGLILLVGILAGWLMFLHVFRTKTLKTIQEMLEQNQLDTVLTKYPKYIAKWKKYQFAPALVKAMRAQERLDDLAISIYEDQLINKDGTYNSQLLLILAKAYAEREKYDETALPIFQEALKIKKNNPYLLRALGRVYRTLNQNDKTVEVFEHLYHQGERDPEVVTTLAKAYLGLSRKDDPAMKIYSEAYQVAASDKELVQKLAELYLSQHQLDQVTIELYQKAVKVDPKCVEYSLAISQYNLQTKNYQDAKLHANNVLEYSPANTAALRCLGQAYLGLQDYQEAITYFEKVYETYKDDKNYIADLAVAYAYLTDISAHAISIYQQAVQNNPKVATYHIALAKAYAEQGDLNKALDELQTWERLSPTDTELISSLYEKLLDKYPSNGAMHRQVIPLYLRMKKIPEALHSLSILTEVDPNQNEFALQAYSAVLDADPKNQIARLERGRLYGFKKKVDEALFDFEILHEQHPKDKQVMEQLDKLYDSKLLQDEENLEVRFKYGLMLYAQADIDRAISQFQKTLRGGYREQESTKYLGLCFQKKGMFDLAYRQLSKLQIADDVKESLYEIGNQYVKSRQYMKAIVVFEQIYSVDINYKDIKDQLEKLRQIPITSAPTGTVSTMSGVPGDIDATVIESGSVSEPKSRYEIMQEIGRGNMGIICLARDKELDEIVALKFLPDELIYDQTVIERFKQEVRSARKLAHPNIVHIYDLNEELGRRFISMEYIQGKNLKDILFEKKKIPASDVVRICHQVASALDYAHSMKIVHRDIKPANIMLNDAGQVKVTDFGIAAMLERAGLTQTGSMVGTPLYMSPEQTEGTAIDGRSDLYSLGVMMYELVTGSPPFSSGNISYQHVHVKPHPPKKVPESLTTIIMKCLEKDPSQRYQNAKELIADLDKCINELKNEGTHS
ncbi:MAG: protein kinase, partial [bacterium]